MPFIPKLQQSDDPITNKEIGQCAAACYVLYPILAVICYGLMEAASGGASNTDKETLVFIALSGWLFAPVSALGLLAFIFILSFGIFVQYVGNFIIPYM